MAFSLGSRPTSKPASPFSDVEVLSFVFDDACHCDFADLATRVQGATRSSIGARRMDIVLGGCLLFERFVRSHVVEFMPPLVHRGLL